LRVGLRVVIETDRPQPGDRSSRPMPPLIRNCVQTRKIDHDCLLRAARYHDHGRIVSVRILFSVRNVRRHEDVVARRRGNANFLRPVMEYELGVSTPYEDRRLGLAMVVVVRNRRRGYVGFTHPDLLGPDRATTDSGQSLHAGRLLRRRAELAALDMMHPRTWRCVMFGALSGQARMKTVVLSHGEVLA
jgi:hypothetical protein